MFVVLRVEAIDSHLHGYVGRFLHEIDSSTYVGLMNRRTVENLWERIVETMTSGKAYLILSDNSREEGFLLRTTPGCSFTAEDHDGVMLIHKRNLAITDL